MVRDHAKVALVCAGAVGAFGLSVPVASRPARAEAVAPTASWFELSSSFSRRVQDAGTTSIVTHAVAYDSGAASDLGWRFKTGLVSVVHDAAETSLTTDLANVLAGAYRSWDVAGSLGFRAGLDLSLRLVSFGPAGERRLERAAKSRALAMTGVSEVGLWAPGAATIGLPAAMALDGRTWARFAPRVTAEAAWIRVLGAELSDVATDFVPVKVELLVGPLLDRIWLGTAGQLVWMPGAAYDETQLSVLPSIGAALGRWEVRLALLLNLDEPYGFGTRGAHVWACRLNVGVHR